MVEFQTPVFEANPHRKANFQENSSFTFPVKKIVSHAKIVFKIDKVSSELQTNCSFHVLSKNFQFHA